METQVYIWQMLALGMFCTLLLVSAWCLRQAWVISVYRKATENLINRTKRG